MTINEFKLLFPNVVVWEIKVGKKKRGRWRTPVNINVSVDNGFYFDYNPRLPSWSKAEIFKDIFFGSNGNCNNMSCSDCEAEMKTIMPFYFYQNANPNDPSCSRFCKYMDKRDNMYMLSFYLEWRPGIPDYSKEIEILKNVVLSLVDKIYDSLIEAYLSEDTDEIILSSTFEDIKTIKFNDTNKTRRKINIA